MRHNTIWSRHSLFLAPLLGICLLGLRWGALGANLVQPVEQAPVSVTHTPTFAHTPTAMLMPAAESAPTAVPALAIETAPATPAPEAHGGQTELNGEIGLQETLDRLGYTVNVPPVYGGHKLLRWNDYRISAGDDAIPAEWFHCGRSATFSMLGQQAMCAPRTVFGSINARGRATALFQPDQNSSGMWLNAGTPARTTADLSGSVSFFIQDASHTLGIDRLTSASHSNFDGVAHLLVLPARTGGTWIDEGDNKGHWQGGKSNGYLLCWEDWNDFDYQDMVILAEHIEPEQPESVAKI